jgi:UDP-glucose 4-epimerase
MRVLVTGGAGFIGSHVVEQLLAAGDEAVVLDDMSTGLPENVPPGVPVVVDDVCRTVDAVAREYRVDAICHQAAQTSVSVSMRDPVRDAETNVLGTVAVLEAARAIGVPVVFASSGGAIYGDVEQWVCEDAPIRPESPYAVSKAACELYLQMYRERYSLPCVSLRYSNVYGPRQRADGESGVVARFVAAGIAGQAVVVNGDGRHTRDYVYVEDVARANVAALKATQLPPALNISTGVSCSVAELSYMVRGRLVPVVGELPQRLHAPERPGDIRCSLPDPTLAMQTLSWRALTDIDDGLDRTVQWYLRRAGKEV